MSFIKAYRCGHCYQLHQVGTECGMKAALDQAQKSFISPQWIPPTPNSRSAPISLPQGITRLDWYAGLAMQAFIQSAYGREDWSTTEIFDSDRDWLAHNSTKLARAMLAEADKEQQK